MFLVRLLEPGDYSKGDFNDEIIEFEYATLREAISAIRGAGPEVKCSIEEVEAD
jgi:hypothetical protein